MTGTEGADEFWRRESKSFGDTVAARWSTYFPTPAVEAVRAFNFTLVTMLSSPSDKISQLGKSSREKMILKKYLRRNETGFCSTH